MHDELCDPQWFVVGVRVESDRVASFDETLACHADYGALAVAITASNGIAVRVFWN